MRRFINPLLLWAAHSRRAGLIRQIQYLKVENEILRHRLPKLVITTRRERERLIRYARKVGPAIKELVSIVKPETVMRGLNPNPARKGPRPRKPGRPRTPAELEALIIRIARETGYHTERPHQAIGNEPLTHVGPTKARSGDRVECHERLGGVLKHYRRAAEDWNALTANQSRFSGRALWKSG